MCREVAAGIEATRVTPGGWLKQDSKLEKGAEIDRCHENESNKNQDSDGTDEVNPVSENKESISP